MRKVMRFAGRDIVRTEHNKESLGFYRSSGHNSGMPGIWLPFDGVGLFFSRLWFDKARYWDDEDKSLHRFGKIELKKISCELGKEKLPAGELATPYQINFFIGSHISLAWNEREQIRNWKPEDGPKFWC